MLHLGRVLSRTGPVRTMPTHEALVPGIAEGHGIWIPPVPEHFVTGSIAVFAKVADIKPIRIPGYWLFKSDEITPSMPPTPSEKIVYCLHGGGYTRLSASPKDVTSAIPIGYLKHFNTVTRCFSVEYRLSSSAPWDPKNPFPAALIDALSGYCYLVNDLGFSPSNIILDGDSAGGNLALALMRYLVENRDVPLADGSKLPAPPGSMILLSPWVDLGRTDIVPGSSIFTNAATDYLDLRSTGGDYPIKSFLGPHGLGAALINPYISPGSQNPGMSISFKGFPRTFIVGGGLEVLIDQIRVLKDKMIKDLGEGDGVQDGEGKVRYLEADEGIHDYLVLAFCEPERTEAFNALAKWVDAA
jgi:acetyl esterase/lipase